MASKGHFLSKDQQPFHCIQLQAPLMHLGLLWVIVEIACGYLIYRISKLWNSVVPVPPPQSDRPEGSREIIVL